MISELDKSQSAIKIAEIANGTIRIVNYIIENIILNCFENFFMCFEWNFDINVLIVCIAWLFAKHM